MNLKKWNKKDAPDQQKVYKLSKELSVSKVICSLLVQRGIDSFEKAKTFFRPQINMLHDPYLMMGMDKAVDRLVSAVSKKEKIRIYGDYDVDGTTSVSIMYHFLQSQNAICDYYIPDRYQEGYGISYIGIDDAIDNGITLMVCLDCGIKAVDKVSYASEKGLEIIICDHHSPGNELPNAYAILDPKRKDCSYPFKELCGCGIGFKLLQAYLIRKKLDLSIANAYLDLVAVAIGADIVPMVGENRVLAYFGLKQLNENTRPGMKALIKQHKRFGEMTITDVVFSIAPRINAAGRMRHAKSVVELLLQEEAEAEKIAVEIEKDNIERRLTDQRITKEALTQIKTLKEEHRQSTVVCNYDWHKGVIGIVASRLIENYYRPTVVFTKSKGHLVASARSVIGFNIYEALDSCSEYIEQFGGHKYAAGLTIKQENYEGFKKSFEKVVSETITEKQMLEPLDIDAELDFSDITPGFFNILKQFEPFGPENRAPLFITRNVIDKGHSRLVGSENEHLKLSICSEKNTLLVMNAIAFNMGAYWEHIRKGLPFDICYSIQENNWKGKTSIQLAVKDIRLQ